MGCIVGMRGMTPGRRGWETDGRFLAAGEASGGKDREKALDRNLLDKFDVLG